MLPWALAATELVKTIVEIIGPLLSVRQTRMLALIDGASSEAELAVNVRHALLKSFSPTQIRLLNSHDSYRLAIESISGGAAANKQAKLLAFKRRPAQLLRTKSSPNSRLRGDD